MPLSFNSYRMVQVILNIWTPLLSNPLMSYTFLCVSFSETFADLCCNNKPVRCLFCCDEVT